jgi:hypothetical protein
LPGFLVGHADSGELAQFFVNQGKQFLSGPRVALFYPLQDARCIAHGNRLRVHTP